VVREGFSGGTRAAFLSYSKSFVDSFLCYNSFVCYANVANSFICYINVKYIWANYVLLKPGVYTPTLKKHQVVRDLKKFENHCFRGISRLGSGFMFLRWFELAHICIQVTLLHRWNKARNQSQILIENRFHVTLRIISSHIQIDSTSFSIWIFEYSIWISDWVLASFTCGMKLLEEI